MLLQTNSYVVPKEKRTEHSRLLNRFRQTLLRLGCESFEVYEQTGANWSSESTGRFVQIMRFRDRKQQLAVQAGERTDPQAQALIQEFCELINFPYQQQQGLFAVGFYNSVLPVTPFRTVALAPAESVAVDSAPTNSDEPPPAAPETHEDPAPTIETDSATPATEDELDRASAAEAEAVNPESNGESVPDSEPQPQPHNQF